MLTPFFEAVLPRVGHLALFSLSNKQHVWAQTIPELVQDVEQRSEQQGVYFATASFWQPSNRTQDNVQALRALRLDIDAGAAKFKKHPDGAYPTQQDALRAVMAFTSAHKLKPSYIISSGEGLHIYYCLTDDAAPEVWMPLASRLGQLCAESGLRADNSVTCDTARVLRPPGTLHPNGQRVAVLGSSGRVYTLEEIRQRLGVAPPSETDIAFAGAETRKFNLAVNEDVRAVEGPPKSIHKISAHCGAVNEAAASRGDVPEPYWRAMIGIVKFTVEGREMAHELSRGHEDYDSGETDRKFDAYGAGPTTCREFAKHSAACATCTHAGKVKSPVQLGALNDAQVAELPPEKQPAPPVPVPAPGLPWDGCMPARFQVVGAPGNYTLQYTMKVTKDDGNGATVTSNVIVPVTNDIFWLGRAASAEDSDDTAKVAVHYFEKGQVVSYLMHQDKAAGQFDLLKWLAGKEIHKTTDKKAGQAMQDYVTLQLQRIKQLTKLPKISGRFGLRIDSQGQLICAHGKYVISPDGKIQEAVLSQELEKSAGDFRMPLPPPVYGEWPASVWGTHIMPAAREYSAFMRAAYGRRELGQYQLAAMLGLASPLMAFVTGSYHTGVELPPNGLSVSLYSKETGQGKTALVQAIMLAFGNPANLVNEGNTTGATDIGRLARLSLWGTLPNSMDEMGQTKESSITQMISAVANGKGRTTGKQTGGFKVASGWALMNLITTNRSQRDMVAIGQSDSPAIQYRLLELNVDDVVFTREDREAYTDGWAKVSDTTQGALGAVIHRAACQLGAAKLNAQVVASVKEADKLLQAEQGARFQYRALGALLFLQKILTHLKLDMFDTQVLIDEFRIAHDSGKDFIAEHVKPRDGATLMTMALVDLKKHTLVTEKETDRRVDRTGFDAPLNVRVPDQVSVRHIVSAGCSYLAVKALHDWCAEHKISERDLILTCRSAGILVAPDNHKPNDFTKGFDMFKGMRESSGIGTRSYKIDTRKLGLSGGYALPTLMDGDDGSASTLDAGAT